MKLNKSATETENNGVATFVVILQVFAWFLAVSYFFGDYTGSDPAGNGMARGMAAIFVTAPSMIFIFLCNFYLIIKKNLSKPYRYIAAANFLGLIILFSSINW
jgi:hypothetical protein